MHTPAHKRFCKPGDMISQTALIVINYSCSLFISHKCGNVKVF